MNPLPYDVQTRWLLILLLIGFLIFPGGAWAQMTVAQKATLKTDITVTNASTTTLGSDGLSHTFTELVAAKDYQPIADWYNVTASPDFYVWRTSISPEEYTGPNAIIWTDVDALAVGKARIFEWMTAGLTKPLNAADPNKRAGIANAFGGGSTTAANLTALGKRKATRGEKLLADTSGGGTGAIGTPATMTFEGKVSRCDVAKAIEGEQLAC